MDNSILYRDLWGFFSGVFEILLIRAKVGKVNGIVFSVRSNEMNHTIPHIHAKYGEYEISVSIKNGEVLAGNLPNKNQKIAVKWVLENKEKLLSDWSNLSLSCDVPGTITMLDKN